MLLTEAREEINLSAPSEDEQITWQIHTTGPSTVGQDGSLPLRRVCVNLKHILSGEVPQHQETNTQ